MDWAYIVTTALGSSGLASILTWLFNRELYKAKAIRDKENVWKEMYEGNNETLIRQNDEIRQLRDGLSRVEGILFQLNACRYYDFCPVKSKLQEYKRSFTNKQQGQPEVVRKNNRLPRDNTDVQSDIGTDDGRPP